MGKNEPYIESGLDQFLKGWHCKLRRSAENQIFGLCHVLMGAAEMLNRIITQAQMRMGKSG
jgi:hypothetical protein